MKKQTLNIHGYGDDLTINNINIGKLSTSDHETKEKKHGGNNYSPVENVVISNFNPTIIEDFVCNYNSYRRRPVFEKFSPSRFIVDQLKEFI